MGASDKTGKNLEELGNGNTGKLLLKYSWPALVAMTLNALYSVVDRIYIGQGCGVDAIAGMTLTMPIMCISSGSAARRMSSGGQPDPAMMPVRMWEKSVFL